MKYLFLFISIIIVILLNIQRPISAQYQPLLSEDAIRFIINEVSGDIALEHIRQLADFHRLQPSPEYHQAAQYIADRAKKYGLQNIAIESFPADGERLSYTYSTFPAWEPKEGELWLTQPTNKRLVSFSEIPLCLATYSRDTDVEAELVDIGESILPSDYEGKDIAGKIILTSAHPASVFPQAVYKRKALGVISYYTIPFQATRKPADYVQQISWGTIPFKGDGVNEPTFAFMISYRMALNLKEMLHRGQKVIVRAKVKAHVFPGEYEIVTAEIPGKEKASEEILFTAHLDHYKPGANDNASGSSAILEIARSLNKLIKENKIETPKRTVRFMWVPEVYGTMAYLAGHPNAFEKTIAVINMDMVGENMRKCKSSLHLYRTPDSLPSYLSDVVQNFFDFARITNNEDFIGSQTNLIISPNGTRDGFSCSVEPYMSGSDHYVFNDNTLSIPAVDFTCWPDVFYHSSEDTPDKCDPTTLKRVAFIGLSSALYLADMDNNTAKRLAYECYSKGKDRLARDYKKAIDLLNNDRDKLTENYKESKIVLKYCYQREVGTLESIVKIAPDDKVLDKLIKKLESNLIEEHKSSQQDIYDYYSTLCQKEQVKPIEFSLDIDEEHHLIPQRITTLRGPIDEAFLYKKLGAHEVRNLKLYKIALQKIYSIYSVSYELVNFIDGERNMLQIRNALSAEFQPIPFEVVEEYLKALEKAGLINIKNSIKK
jgi:hypothetical protein